MIEGSGGFCKIVGCGLKHYSRGFCKMHYQRILIGKSENFNPGLLKVKGGRLCLFEGCSKLGYYQDGYCFLHWRSEKRGIPLDINLRSLVKMGKKNPQWKGGIAEYEKHSIMKKSGKEKLKATNYTCQICFGKASEIHHLDRTKNNHDLKNLLALCHKCHFSVFHKQKHTSKYLREYGMRQYDIIKMLHFSFKKIKMLHMSGKLKTFMYCI